LESGLLAFTFFRIRKQRSDLHKLLSLVTADRERTEPAVRNLIDLLSDIANAAARGGDSLHMISKRLDRILSSSRGEGRTIKEQFLILSDLYDSGLITWLKCNYPELTRNEIGLCGMITIGLDPACIDKIFGYDHEQTFYNRRADIRRKLGLDRQIPLERFLTEQAELLREEHEILLRNIRKRN